MIGQPRCATLYSTLVENMPDYPVIHQTFVNLSDTDPYPSSNPNFLLDSIAFASHNIANSESYAGLEFLLEGGTGVDDSSFTTLFDGGGAISFDIIPTTVVGAQTPCSTSAISGAAVTCKGLAGCQPGVGDAEATVTFTKPSTCVVDGASQACTSVAVDVKRGGTTAVTGTCSGTSCTYIDTLPNGVGTTPSYTITATGSLSTGGCTASTANAAPASACKCGEAPAVTLKTQDIRAYANSPLTLTFNITDEDSDIPSGISSVLLKYTNSPSAGTPSVVTVPVSSISSNGDFSAVIPAGGNIGDIPTYFWVEVQDDTPLTGTYPANFDINNIAGTAGSYDVLLADRFSFLSSSDDGCTDDVIFCPNINPFKAAYGQKLYVNFRTVENSALTMRIYTMDGNLVRQIQSTDTSNSGSITDCDNCCHWTKGCTWDGTVYDGGTNLVTNGLYIVNFHAVSVGAQFPNAEADYTKGIVVMK